MHGAKNTNLYSLFHSSYMFRRYYLAVFRLLTPNFFKTQNNDGQLLIFKRLSLLCVS